MNISTKQRRVLKVMRGGGLLYPWKKSGGKTPKYKYRLLDFTRSPVMYVHGRTFKALVLKQLITKQSDGSYASIGANN